MFRTIQIIFVGVLVSGRVWATEFETALLAKVDALTVVVEQGVFWVAASACCIGLLVGVQCFWLVLRGKDARNLW
jgi:hypothetical protein